MLEDTWKRVRRERFIPAYTGNAPGGVARQSHGPVYPRVYGECSKVGADKNKPARFIPAYTGNANQGF